MAAVVSVGDVVVSIGGARRTQRARSKQKPDTYSSYSYEYDYSDFTVRVLVRLLVMRAAARARGALLLMAEQQPVDSTATCELSYPEYWRIYMKAISFEYRKYSGVFRGGGGGGGRGRARGAAAICSGRPPPSISLSPSTSPSTPPNPSQPLEPPGAAPAALPRPLSGASASALPACASVWRPAALERGALSRSAAASRTSTATPITNNPFIAPRSRSFHINHHRFPHYSSQSSALFQCLSALSTQRRPAWEGMAFAAPCWPLRRLLNSKQGHTAACPATRPRHQLHICCVWYQLRQVPGW